MKWLPIILLLAACSKVPTYEPQLSKSPDDQGKYQADLTECRVTAQNPGSISPGQSVAIGALGVVGMLGSAAVADSEDPAFMTPYEVIDRCMAKRGYAVVKVTHCC